jgi:hypothetical protein
MTYERSCGDRYALSALRNRRASLASDIVQLERKLRHCRESVVHVDATLRLHDGTDSASMSDPRPQPGTPAARSPNAPRMREPRRAVEQRTSPLSAVDVLQDRVVEHRLGQKLLQFGVLVLERLQPTGIRYVEATNLGLPLLERRARHPMLAAHIRRGASRLLLPQDPDDQFFAEPATLHRPSHLK